MSLTCLGRTLMFFCIFQPRLIILFIINQSINSLISKTSENGENHSSLFLWFIIEHHIYKLYLKSAHRSLNCRMFSVSSWCLNRLKADLSCSTFSNIYIRNDVSDKAALVRFYWEIINNLMFGQNETLEHWDSLNKPIKQSDWKNSDGTERKPNIISETLKETCRTFAGF